MKVNYDKLMLDILNSLDYRPKLLLHSCCGPCSTYVIETLIEYFDITVYYYNPNIEPIEEYEKRKNEQIKFINMLHDNRVNYIDGDYDNKKFSEITKDLKEEDEGKRRCFLCFRLRLEETARYASVNKYDYFATTLTVSPYKNSYIINNLGNRLEKEYNVKYLVSDFKKRDGYKSSLRLSSKYNLYRQHYCGCLSSLNSTSK